MTSLVNYRAGAGTNNAVVMFFKADGTKTVEHFLNAKLRLDSPTLSQGLG